jgi:fumarate reductase subunit C
MAVLRRRAAKPRENARLLAISFCALLVVAVFASAGSNESYSLGTRIQSNPIIVASVGITAAARAWSREANRSFENS